jgi:uncharacterized protein YkwD
MHLRVALVMAIAAAGCVYPIAPASTRPAPPAVASTSAFGATESQIFELINGERRRQGLPALVYNPLLDRMAKIQAQNMAHFQKMAHVLPDASLPALADRARYTGYPYSRLAENIALGYPDASAVVDGWMSSKGHRANILNRDVLETGIGVARSSAGGLYYCEVFGRRLGSL